MHLRGRLHDRTGVFEIVTTGETITALRQLETDCGGDLPVILPGLADIQVNGYGGFDFNGPKITEEVVKGCVKALWQWGITAICPTLITNRFETTLEAVKVVARACEADPLVDKSILGIHLEGPYISEVEGPRGAHDAEYVRDPDWGEWQELQDAAGGRIRLVTLAPERRGAIDFITRLVKNGVTVSLGHTAATPDVISAAIDAGATMVTHIGNGVNPYLHRHDSYIWEELSRDELTASMICDGIHLPDRVIKTVLRAKGVERTILVSDSLGMAGLPPGDYPSFAGVTLRVRPDGRIVRADSGKLSGSSFNLFQCMEHASRFPEAGFNGAVRMAAENPRRLLKGGSPSGVIEVGARADFTVIDRVPDGVGTSSILATSVAGKLVFLRSGYSFSHSDIA